LPRKSPRRNRRDSKGNPAKSSDAPNEANWRAGHIARSDDEPQPWYDELLNEEVEQGGNPDKSAIVIPEQSQPHVIFQD